MATEQPASKELCPHAPVYQRTPIGEVRVGCPWCRDAEIAQLRLGHEPKGRQYCCQLAEDTGLKEHDIDCEGGVPATAPPPATEPPVTLEQCREMFGLPPEQDPLIDKLERELSDTREAYLNQSARLIQAEMTQELPYAWVRSDGGCFQFSRDDARPGGKGWIPLYRRAGDSPPAALRAPIDGPFEVWFKPIDGTRGVLDERNGITLQVFGFVDADEHRKYCEELANTLNARTAPPPGDSYVVHRRHLVRGALSPMHSSDWIEVRLVPGLEPGCTSRGIEPRLANVAAANQAHEPDTSYSRNELLARLTECELALHNYAPHSEYFLRWELGGSALTKCDAP